MHLDDKRTLEKNILSLLDDLLEVASDASMAGPGERARLQARGREIVQQLSLLTRDLLEGQEEYLSTTLRQLIQQKLPGARMINSFGSFSHELNQIVEEGILEFEQVQRAAESYRIPNPELNVGEEIHLPSHPRETYDKGYFSQHQFFPLTEDTEQVEDSKTGMFEGEPTIEKKEEEIKGKIEERIETEVEEEIQAKSSLIEETDESNQSEEYDQNYQEEFSPLDPIEDNQEQDLLEEKGILDNHSLSSIPSPSELLDSIILPEKKEIKKTSSKSSESIVFDGSIADQQEDDIFLHISHDSNFSDETSRWGKKLDKAKEDIFSLESAEDLNSDDSESSEKTIDSMQETPLLRVLSLLFPNEDCMCNFAYRGFSLDYYFPKLKLAIEEGVRPLSPRKEFFCRQGGITLVQIDESDTHSHHRIKRALTRKGFPCYKREAQ